MLMQKAILRIQWKACWHLVLALSVAAFALPIVSVRLGWHDATANLPLFLTELQLWGLFYPLLAAVTAIVVATGIWMSDRRGQHVYAMLLPLPRWRYVMLRYAGGLILLAPIIVSLWLGAIVATIGLDLPPGIRTFPHALAFKYALTLLLMFGFAFALASTSSRTIGVAIRVLGLFLVVHVAVILISPHTNLLWLAAKALATWPGPFAPMGGRWMLIDV
jgi:ABC-type transport system involved in multi-copper enzyme maturation permease subunit